MKQLTMTKVLTPLAALAFAFGVQAAAVSTEAFDGSSDAGTSVTNRTGWSFAPGADLADDASVITAYDNNAPASNLVPDGMSAGANYLKLSTEDGTLFRNMDGAATGNSVDLNAGLFVDTDVQFTITDPSDRPEVTADDKFIIWLEDQGADGTNLCVWAKQFTANDGSTSVSNVYYLVANDNSALNITPGAWYRLTVKAISSVGSGVTFPAFQVFLNGQQLKAKATTGQFIIAGDSNAVTAFETATGGSGIVSGQAYFPAMASEMSSLTKVGFSGEGQIDSVAVTHDIPADFPALPRTAITFSWDSPAIASVSIGAPFYETVTSSGSVLTATPDQTFTMTVNYASGYSSLTHDITAASGNNYATVDGMVVTAVSAGAATITFTAIAKDTVDVTFDWSAFFGSGSEAASAVQSIVFNVGGVETPANLNDPENKLTLNSLKVGTNITVTVTFSPASWTATLEQDTTSTDPGTATLSIADNSVTINTRGDGKATVIVGAVSAGPAIPNVTPGTDTAATYSAADAATIVAAINADKDTYINAPSGLSSAAADAYKDMFEASAVQVGDTYKIVTSLTSEAEADLQAQANADVATIAAGITGSGAISITATPGFYYSLKEGTTLTNMAEGTRTLATGDTVSLTPTKSGTSGFYKVLVNIAPAE